MKPKISLITLGVSDFQKSLHFYRDGLGFSPHNYKEGDDVVFFEMEGTWISLYNRKKLAEDATVSYEGTGFSGITLAHNVSSKEIKKPQEVFWGGYSAYFADPDGHLWEVAFNPFMDLT